MSIFWIILKHTSSILSKKTTTNVRANYIIVSIGYFCFTAEDMLYLRTKRNKKESAESI